VRTAAARRVSADRLQRLALSGWVVLFLYYGGRLEDAD
jgi:hypothetical protein